MIDINIINKLIKELTQFDERFILTGSCAVEILKIIYLKDDISLLFLTNNSDIDFIFNGTVIDTQKPFNIQKSDWIKLSDPLTLNPVTYLVNNIKVDIIVTSQNFENKIIKITFDNQVFNIIHPKILVKEYQEILEDQLENIVNKKYSEKINILQNILQKI